MSFRSYCDEVAVNLHLPLLCVVMGKGVNAVAIKAFKGRLVYLGTKEVARLILTNFDQLEVKEVGEEGLLDKENMGRVEAIVDFSS
ncbi:hypothetical protein RIF29_21203 [Crotalaria pallida]|uniref:Uncharacterized protein n=1 Tax=Crotalaria pallida TaxID=3830 RepID=A0AAN9F4B7_CROPI